MIDSRVYKFISELTADELVALRYLVKTGKLAPPPGAGPLEAAQKISEVLNGVSTESVGQFQLSSRLNDEQLLESVEGLQSQNEIQYQSLNNNLKVLLENIRAELVSLQGYQQSLLQQWKETLDILQPSVPVAEVETGWQWSNLWRHLCFVPGTFMPRFLLTIWEYFLQSITAGGTLVGVILGGWTGGILGAIVGAVTAFFVHEVAFAPFVSRIVKSRLANDNDVIGKTPGALYAFERWIGPVC